MTYKPGCTFNLYKHGKLIGNMFSNFMTKSALFHYACMCIENYNQNLVTSDLPDEVFAHRFFDLENVECTKNNTHSIIMPTSYNHVVETYPTFAWPDISEQILLGEIGLYGRDIAENTIKTDSSINIWLENRIVYNRNLINLVTKDEYCEMKGISERDFDKINFPEFEDPYQLYFNETEDFFNAMMTGIGAKSPGTDLIYIIKT